LVWVSLYHLDIKLEDDLQDSHGNRDCKCGERSSKYAAHCAHLCQTRPARGLLTCSSAGNFRVSASDDTNDVEERDREDQDGEMAILSCRGGG